MDLIGLLEKQYAKTGEWVNAVRPEQLGGPTPCTEWDARTLLNHMIGGNYMFATVVPGGEMDFSQTPPDFTVDDLTGHYERSSKGALEAFRAPDAMERMVTVPIGTFPGSIVLGFALTDAVVHGWDLARATGQDATLDDDVASTLYAMLENAIPPEYRQAPANVFKDPVPVGPDASPTDRLVAFLGRMP